MTSPSTASGQRSEEIHLGSYPYFGDAEEVEDCANYVAAEPDIAIFGALRRSVSRIEVREVCLELTQFKSPGLMKYGVQKLVSHAKTY
jgi:hypothetical protein